LRGRRWLVWMCGFSGGDSAGAGRRRAVYPGANIPLRLMRGELRYIAIGEGAGGLHERTRRRRRWKRNT
jgi:hypothetical protein